MKSVQIPLRTHLKKTIRQHTKLPLSPNPSIQMQVLKSDVIKNYIHSIINETAEVPLFIMINPIYIYILWTRTLDCDRCESSSVIAWSQWLPNELHVMAKEILKCSVSPLVFSSPRHRSLEICSVSPIAYRADVLRATHSNLPAKHCLSIT